MHQSSGFINPAILQNWFFVILLFVFENIFRNVKRGKNTFEKRNFK